MLSNRRTILHVDDEPLITKLVARHLEKASYEVDALHDPLEVLEKIEREQYRVVLLDVEMPIKSGIILLSEIKALNCGIQVIMLSGIVTPTVVLEALHLGAEAYHFKPFDDPQPLLDTIGASFKKIDRWWNAFRDLAQRSQPEKSGKPLADLATVS